MRKFLLSLLNPLNLFRAYQFNRKNEAFDKSAYDLELHLYSKILKNDMLHYGYFEDTETAPDTISIKQIEDAQRVYAQRIIGKITNSTAPVLDIGCGMGGLSAMLHEKGFAVESLTPNRDQIAHITKKYPALSCHNCTFEDFKTSKKFGTLINSESLQYIPLASAFQTAEKIAHPGATWIIVDYFRTKSDGTLRSPHAIEDFLKIASENGWRVAYEKDITPNVLPTIRVAHMYATRFLLPVAHFALEKLRYKQPWLYYLTRGLQESVYKKMNKELATVDPQRFFAERKYMHFVLEKKNSASSK